MAKSEWRPTHVVGTDGVDAMPEPNPDPEVVPWAHLEAGVRLAVRRRWGDWVQVQCIDGWTGWVDGRPLELLD